MMKMIIKSWDEVYKETAQDIKAGKVQKEGKIIYVESIEAARKLITNQRMRLLSTVKNRKPDSLYQLAKMMNKDIKTISSDVSLLSGFGLIRLESHKNGMRRSVRPVVSLSKIQMELAV